MAVRHDHQHTSDDVIDFGVTPPGPIDPAGGGLPPGGSPGQVVTNTAPGEGAWDDVPSGATPTLAEVLAAGSDTGGTAITGVTATALIGIAPTDGNPSYVSFAGGVSIVSADGDAGLAGTAIGLQAGSGDAGASGGAFLTLNGGGGDGTGGGANVTGADAVAASGKAGGDVTLTPGAGDGAGAHGKIVLDGPVDYGSNAPTLAEVLTAGNDPGGYEITATSGGEAGLVGGDLDPNVGPYGSSVRARGAVSGAGGYVEIAGGTSADVDGDNAGGIVRTRGGDAVAGGAVEMIAGNGGQNGVRGGDITLTPGTGNGARNGLVFLNLPTSDPGVAGALYEDSVTHAVMVSQG